VSTGDDQARRAAAGTIRRPADQLLPLLSRSRPRASSAGHPIVSRVIRVSDLRAEQGPALAVLKVARDPGRAGELCAASPRDDSGTAENPSNAQSAISPRRWNARMR
jgi:hypothetical protein